MKQRGWIVGIGAAVTVVGCTYMHPYQQQTTMTGAALGAAGGAGIAAIAGGNPWTGAIVGGAAGAVAGNIRGANPPRRGRW